MEKYHNQMDISRVSFSSDNLKSYFSKVVGEDERMLRIVKKSLKNVPEGGLRIAQNRKRYQYFHLTKPGEKTGEYIRVSNVSLAQKLAQKDYDRKLEKLLNRRIENYKKIGKLLEVKETWEIYETLSDARKELVEAYEVSNEEYARKWEAVSYIGNNFYPMTGDIFTDKGEQVRSKSEKMIADWLYQKGIPYRYEYPLNLDGCVSIYPDFTFLDINNRVEYYLEHFGMMDNPEYCEKAVNKIQLYEKKGLYLGDKLLLCFETASKPLDMRVVSGMIERTLGLR